MAGCSSSPPKTSLASLALRNENQSARPTVRTDVWLIGAIGVVNCSVASVVPDKQRRAIKLRSRWKTGQDRQKPKEHENSLVRAVDIVNGEDGQIAIVSEVSRGDAGAGLELAFIDNGLGHVQGDGHGEEVAVGETDIFANTEWSELPSAN